MANRGKVAVSALEEQGSDLGTVIRILIITVGFVLDDAKFAFPNALLRAAQDGEFVPFSINLEDIEEPLLVL